MSGIPQFVCGVFTFDERFAFSPLHWYFWQSSLSSVEQPMLRLREKLSARLQLQGKRPAPPGGDFSIAA